MNPHHKPSRRQSHPLVLAVLALVTLAACSGGSPSAPSAVSSTGVVLKGSLVGSTSGSASASSSTAPLGLGALSSGLSSITGTVTVSVQGSPAITTTVAADGSFTLRGLPDGSFTLLFTRDGAPLGTLSFNSVMPNQELTITVSVTGTTVALLQEQRNGIGHGDLEIEGRVEQVLLLSTTGDSRFVIASRTVVARPGVTAIREGNKSRTVADLVVGARVHVKGAWLPVESSTQPVLAAEIKLQDDDEADDDDGEDDDAPTSTCLIQGGSTGRSVQLEGSILSGNSASFRLTVNGGRASGPVDVLAGGATLECTPKSGPNAPTPAQCAASVTAGAKVHVSGNLDTCTPTAALVSASKVKVQK
jgi:hypothetical protein